MSSYYGVQPVSSLPVLTASPWHSVSRGARQLNTFRNTTSYKHLSTLHQDLMWCVSIPLCTALTIKYFFSVWHSKFSHKGWFYCALFLRRHVSATAIFRPTYKNTKKITLDYTYYASFLII
jgi:hypothetical protein